ncbi:putative transcriptional regulator, RpiR family [Burkholderia ambifaria MEX-5]|uniref:Putative transcriptional regulator, RpiR family n=1 Tax=Burkholderia ambifaria MEX-5 TaxID=396597 RepID=B1T449_9BURK|nr:putative transcriptional regulator, RpiR family [Burkholderia ambifaria MEX-5]
MLSSGLIVPAGDRTTAIHHLLFKHTHAHHLLQRRFTLTCATRVQAKAPAGDVSSTDCSAFGMGRQQTGAAFLLDNPDQVAVLSMRKVAERANGQPAAMVRLAQQLGYPGWSELREVFVSRVRTRPEPLTSRVKTLIKGRSGNSLSHRLTAAQTHNLELPLQPERTGRQSRRETAAQGAACACRRFQVMLSGRIRPGIRLSIVQVDGQPHLRRSRHPRDGASRYREQACRRELCPYSVEAVRVAEAAVNQGARLNALTDSVVSPIALNADQVLLFSHDTPSFFPSLLAANALAELLVAQLLSLEGPDAIKWLGVAETALHERGAYTP